MTACGSRSALGTWSRHTTGGAGWRARLAGLVLAVAWLPIAWAGDGLVPHEARYALSLLPTAEGRDVSALQGSMELRFVASCDGWRIEQALAFRMLTQDGTGLEHLAQFDAFEEADGSGLVFSARTWEDRVLVEQLSGTARRRHDGTVEVRYSQPEARTDVLPPETLFPNAHVAAVLAAAQAGRRVSMSTVFDGSSVDNPFQISSVIGERTTAPPDAPAALARHAAWPVRLAYFGLQAVEPQPDFEMSVMLYDNGIAGDMIYDYGDFAIDVRLEDATLLDMPRCM